MKNILLRLLFIPVVIIGAVLLVAYLISFIWVIVWVLTGIGFYDQLNWIDSFDLHDIFNI